MENSNLNVSMEETNLERFLIRTTPLVPSQTLSKNERRKLNKLWNPCDEKDEVKYYSLSDLWSKNFERWSAYGVGVPIALEDGASSKKMHYFTPTLSAIQIFTGNKCLRQQSGASTSDAKDLFSDSLSEESESEEFSFSSSEEAALLSEPDSSGLPNKRLGSLYCQYFETLPPYCRVPFMDMIESLAQSYPGLKTLRSVDVSPASWMAIAWYPIYPIPTSRTIKDFRACFLTYHTFSSSLDQGEIGSRANDSSIGLAPFALASLKVHGDVWITEKDGRDQQRLMDLWSVADSWLKQLGVQHHDFNYFSAAAPSFSSVVI